MPDVGELVRSGVLRMAELPPENPRHLDFARFTIPLIGHDYPALTASLWNRAYQALGLAVGNIMMIGDPSRLPEILNAFRGDSRYLGGGAGVGFKERAAVLADELDPVSEAIGSVNFLLKTADGTLRGYNTDGEGYALSLEEKGRAIRDARILILGAGGTAAAIGFALAARGARITIVNRNVDRARALAARLQTAFAGEDRIAGLVTDADVIVNTTTKGSAGAMEHYSALAPADANNQREGERILGRIPRTALLSDVVINAGGTPFLRAARDGGFDMLDGLAMVKHQAVEAFRLLHGFPVEEISAAMDCRPVSTHRLMYTW